MAQTSLSMENLFSNWNAEFPGHTLTPDHLKKPLSFMRALFYIFDKLGIDTEALVQPPEEKDLNDHLPYYKDLVSVINVTRIINHLITVLPTQMCVSINHVLQPVQQSSSSILLLLFNLMLFYEARMSEIAPKEEELFQQAKMVENLEERKLRLQEQLNNKAHEKGERAMRVEKMNQEIVELEEQLQLELQTRDQNKQDLDVILKENAATQKLLDHKKALMDDLTAEMERLKALRVYDAEDIKAKAAQAMQKVQEAEKKLSTLGAIIAQKENSLNILQTKSKPSLDTANHLLEEITKLKQDSELGDLESDSKDGELQMLHMTEAELKAQLAEVRARREEAYRRRNEAVDKRDQDRTALESAIRKSEDLASKRSEFITCATQRIHELKEATKQYEREKHSGTQDIHQMMKLYDSTMMEWDEALSRLLEGVTMALDSKLRGAQSE